MEALDYLVIALFLFAIAAVSFTVGYKINSFLYEKLQRDLVDMHETLTQKIKELIQTKKKWYDLAKQVIEYEQALKELRRENKNLENTFDNLKKANEEIYNEGFCNGKNEGRLDIIKTIGKSMIDDSEVIKAGIVSKADPLINQVKNLK